MSHTRKPRASRAPNRLPKNPDSTWGARLKTKETALILVFVILAAIPFGLGKYFEFNSPDAFDGGAYIHSAAHILAGAEIGVEEKPSAQLGTLLVNILGVWMFGYGDIGPGLIQMFLQAGAFILMFLALRKVFGMGAAGLGILIASIYLSCPLLAKYGNVKEQFMITFMIMGVSCFVLYLCSGRWWLALLAGALLAWGPLFKQTALSAVGGVGLFVILQPLLKHRTWKQMGRDVGFLLAGVVAGIGPLYVWILAGHVQLSLPYAFLWKILVQPLLSSGDATGKATVEYVSTSRSMIPFSEQWPRVLRYYSLLLLPISLALGAIAVRLGRWTWPRMSKKTLETQGYERFVLLFAIWWILDMTFVWISPRSYEQYYLPLNASAAMLSGYLVALYTDALRRSLHKGRWVLTGLVAVIVMVAMSWHIFFGITKSPHSGTIYRDRRTGDVRPSRGYAQKKREIDSSRQPGVGRGPWEQVASYIQTHSEPTDRIYVWGWYPGIYVYAQRFSAASTACTITRIAPSKLETLVQEMLTEFELRKPKFIVDSRKRHLPLERPPYELWPVVPKGFMGAEQAHLLPPTDEAVQAYERMWTEVLRKQFGEDEAKRFEILTPLRGFVREHYQVVKVFGGQILFEVKETPADKEL
ncbi:hypothetical protein ACFL6U_19715 [Planctomycetota bacterium]